MLLFDTYVSISVCISAVLYMEGLCGKHWVWAMVWAMVIENVSKNVKAKANHIFV